MRGTFTGRIMAGLLFGAFAMVASGDAAVGHAERHRQSHHQRVGAEHEQHRHRRESDDSHQHRPLVEPVAASAPDRHVSREEAGRAASRAGEAAGGRSVQLSRLHGARSEQHHASGHGHPLRDEFPRRGRRPAHRRHHAARDRLSRGRSTSPAPSTIPSRCSRCGSTGPARARARWRTRRRSTSTRRRTPSSSRTTRASRCA